MLGVILALLHRHSDTMAPKRKTAAAEPEPGGVEPSPKKSKAGSGLSVGDDFPDLGPIETEESSDAKTMTVDLKARKAPTTGSHSSLS